MLLAKKVSSCEQEQAFTNIYGDSLMRQVAVSKL